VVTIDHVLDDGPGTGARIPEAGNVGYPQARSAERLNSR
jgi:hypothetical protein